MARTIRAASVWTIAMVVVLADTGGRKKREASGHLAPTADETDT